METHRVTSKAFTLPQGQEIDIKYWADTNKVYAAGFDKAGKKVTNGTYEAEIDIADGFDLAFKQSLIDGLVTTIESDLLTNPSLHLKP